VARCFVLVATLAALAGGCEPGGFVATEADLAPFASWTRFDRGEQPVGPVHPDGSSVVYINHLPPTGSRAFPDRTMIVRVTAGALPDPGTWEVHAMVKRGAGFNGGGAEGWEFFDLLLWPDDAGNYAPRILWRGASPPQGNGYEAPDGGGVELSCNHCHGAAVDNDSVLGPELDLDLF
jgi:hypothetical protein